MLILNKNILTIGGNRLEGGPLTPPSPPTPPTPQPSFDEVTIGSQTWMSKNLDIDDGGTGIYHYDNVTANGVNFGTQYYYTLDAAIRIANSINGWHLPSRSEFQTLVNYVGSNSATKLKSASGWNDASSTTGSGNGTDNYGFTGLPVGYSDSNGSKVWNKGSYLYLHSSTIYSSDVQYNYNLYLDYSDTTARISKDYVTKLYSVRLIKDT